MNELGRTASKCGDCFDEATRWFADAVYCDQHTLERLIRALRAEAKLANRVSKTTTRVGILIDS